jgi:glycerol-3-phosphate dehydrogenase
MNAPSLTHTLPSTGASASVLETEVLIIGGGVTGAGIMRDLALRGIHSILIDKRDLCAGASGGNHGLLHSGARYVSTDLEAAIECRQEGALLKQLAPQCIEAAGGLFVAVEGDDAAFAERFPALCAQAGIVCDELSLAEARQLEPLLSERLIKALRVPDATIDPFQLALRNVGHARQLTGSVYLPHTELLGFASADGDIHSATCRDQLGQRLLTIRARQFVNAGGAWSMTIARLAGCADVHLLYAKGTILVTNDRLTRHVVNRLRPPGDGDILVPGGSVSLLGTTSSRTDDLERVSPTADEIDRNLREGSAMIPALAGARYIRAFSRVRPLLQAAPGASDRAATRGFALLDHRSQGLNNFCTITGGKLTTYRLMAEKTADLVAARLGKQQACSTHQVPLPDDPACGWSDPTSAPKRMFAAKNPDDLILCECEMLPQSAIAQIFEGAPGIDAQPTLESIALRSRAGKGPCQGSFCGIRIGSYLYDQGLRHDRSGLTDLRHFFDERFKGQRSVSWGQQAAQLELAEAMHCGLLGLDTLGDD